MTLKEQMIDVIQRLPEDASVERAIDELYLLAKIRTGLQQADAGEVISHEELKRQLLARTVY
jgi:predicted transcriptional regulator